MGLAHRHLSSAIQPLGDDLYWHWNAERKPEFFIVGPPDVGGDWRQVGQFKDSWTTAWQFLRCSKLGTRSGDIAEHYTVSSPTGPKLCVGTSADPRRSAPATHVSLLLYPQKRSWRKLLGELNPGELTIDPNNSASKLSLFANPKTDLVAYRKLRIGFDLDTARRDVSKYAKAHSPAYFDNSNAKHEGLPVRSATVIEFMTIQILLRYLQT